MGNVIGEVFRKGVREQVNLRQEKMGSLNRDNDIINFQNNTNAFLRLASSVNISQEISDQLRAKEIQTEGVNYSGAELAKNFVLYNGVTAIDANFSDGKTTIQPNDQYDSILRQGINNNPNILFRGAYGFGGLEMGHRPMPGLVSANVSFYNRGSLKTAEVQIKAFNPTQFEIIEILYMRVGFTVLLEWGHTQYWDNETKKLKVETDFSTDPINSLFGEDVNTEDMLNLIETERKDRFYNYDAIYGKIRNFNWTFNPDGTYDITINIISIGDVIESLNINKNFSKGILLNMLSDEIVYAEDENLGTIRKDSIILKENQVWYSSLHKYLWNVKTSLNEKEGSTLNKHINLTSDNGESIDHALVKIGFQNTDIDTKGGKVNPNQRNNQYYIKLGRLLQFIQDNLLYYNGSSGDDPIVSIDTDFNNNFCLTYPQQFSADPRICIIPIKYANTEITPNLNWGFMSGNLGDSFLNRKNNNPYVGNLMHLHVNLNHIYDTYENLAESNKEGNVSLFYFLQNLMNGIGDALGGVNNFTVTYNNETNKVVIREDNNLRYEEFLKKEIPTEFYLYGMESNLGSIVKDINFNVEISSNFATMVSIGAQSNGNPQGENATLLSSLYKGTTDRISPKKLDYSGTEDELPKTPSEEINIQKLNEVLTNTYGRPNLKGTDKVNGGDLNSSNISLLKSISKIYSRYITGYLNQTAQIPALGFFPFDLQLTIPGLSGMRVYEKFKITEKILPSMYREGEKSKLDFIIKGVNHQIQNNKWDTILTTLTTPSAPIDPIQKYDIPLIEDKVRDGVCGIMKIFTENFPQTILTAEERQARINKADFAFNRLFGITERDVYKGDMPQITFENGNPVWNGFEDLAFPKSGESFGICARYSYNFAQLFAKGIENKTPQQNPWYKQDWKSKTLKVNASTAGGAARSDEYSKKLTDLKYKKYKIGTSLPKRELKKILEGKGGLEFQAGDIVTYFPLEGEIGKSYFESGHTQYYLGKGQGIGINHSSPALMEKQLKEKKQITSGNLQSDWGSSIRNNYGAPFIYNRKDSVCWDLYLYRMETAEDEKTRKERAEERAERKERQRILKKMKENKRSDISQNVFGASTDLD